MFGLTRRKLNIAFWGFFILAGTTLISGLITDVIFLDLLLSAVVIAVGFHGLLEELADRNNKKAFKRIDESLFQLTEWMDRVQAFAKAIKEKHELRLHRLDTKRAHTEQKLEKKTREMTKKMVDLENQLNSFKKNMALLELAAPEKRYSKAISILRNKGVITAATYSRMLAVTKSTAEKDLTRMADMGVVKKSGRGKAAPYVLAI